MSRSDDGRTALHWAAAAGLTHVAQLLLASEQLPSVAAAAATQQVAIIGDGLADGVPPQHMEGATAKLEPLPPLVELQDRNGNTALHLAAQGGHSELLATILAGTVPQLLPPFPVSSFNGSLKAFMVDFLAVVSHEASWFNATRV